ncbi:major facilitator superfamily domain-containing protein [Melanogaster broomeanus]|nr:major facilitator superfamily domain-containing protein [Melanogaster broomeanus]
MPLDRIITDPIISTENSTFSPSRSRPPVEHLPAPTDAVLPTERDPLVGAPQIKKPFYRARPLWLVPFALTASITRGMTLASRVQVFTELSCIQIRDNYNHTSTPSISQALYAPVPHSLHSAPSNVTPLYFPSIPPSQSLEESTGDGVHEGNDPRVIPGQTCISDPAVQAGAARLQVIMTTTMGALSTITTGWWGHFGERYGRTRVLAISTLGLFLTDLAFILVSTPHNPLADHSHKLLIIAPIIEGSLGGWSSLTGANTAYVADCTSPGSRSTIFARFTGVMYVGFALGPIIGAWLISHPIPFLIVGTIDHPLRSVNSVFWVAITCSFVNLLLVLFVFPESLSPARQAANRKGKNRTVEVHEPASSGKVEGRWIIARILTGLLSPLRVLLPSDVPVARAAGGEMPGRSRTRKDWSLTFLALSLFCHLLATGIFQIKYLYAEHIYDWGAEQLSYYISFMGASRAAHLLFLLPFLLSTFKPVRAAVSSAVSSQVGPKAKPKPTRSHLFSEIRFDLLVVRFSFLIEFCSHSLVVLCPIPSNDSSSTWWSQFMFVGATCLTCGGAGALPATQSIALSTLQGRTLAEKEEAARLHGGTAGTAGEHDAEPESGKLFGALAVLQAAGQTIIGPILFGVIYSSTVASYPKAIFATAAGLALLSVTLTLFVRPDVSLPEAGISGHAGPSNSSP